jgi:pimeloyl-ACP methyl ester carboxylesterase
MTIILSMRSQAVGGATIDPLVYQDQGSPGQPAYKPISWKQFGDKAAGLDLVFVVHGFNVSAQQGTESFFLLADELDLPATTVLIGVLWPGDYWLPFINYPFEGGTAKDCGRRIARLCDGFLSGAASISFVTHSLGARLALEATAQMTKRVRTLCLMAGAVTNDCLTNEYAPAKDNCDDIYVLASQKDWVLQKAFPIGDLFGAILEPDHAPLRAALGFDGPNPAGIVTAPWQIDGDDGYSHEHYLPPATDGKTGRWRKAAAFVRNALTGAPRPWPQPK